MIAALTLYGDRERTRAIEAIRAAPPLARVRVDEPKRSLDQNALAWALWTDISQQAEWYGQKLPPEDWRLIFLAGLKREVRIVPNLDANGFVDLSGGTSKLNRSEFSDLIELTKAWGARHNIVFSEPEGMAA